jgi:glyoxylase-like metal-dependent hydrolase (beta-lactamase superfamily II)
MILRQLLHTEPVVAASYFVACGGHGVAMVVDPVGDLSTYLEIAAATNTRITHVVDTHVHADHLSAGPALAHAADAAYVLHETAGAHLPHTPARDGDRIELGNVSAEVLHVPGHTPEHLALLVTDRTRGTEPWFVLTGHTLMVGDMGRTELATDAEVGARALFRSAERLRALPDHVEILPGAFSGSVCGRSLSGKPWSTIGFERRFNHAFAITDETEFVQRMLRDIPPRPDGADEIRDRNLGIAPAMRG